MLRVSNKKDLAVLKMMKKITTKSQNPYNQFTEFFYKKEDKITVTDGKRLMSYTVGEDSFSQLKDLKDGLFQLVKDTVYPVEEIIQYPDVSSFFKRMPKEPSFEISDSVSHTCYLIATKLDKIINVFYLQDLDYKTFPEWEVYSEETPEEKYSLTFFVPVSHPDIVFLTMPMKK